MNYHVNFYWYHGNNKHKNVINKDLTGLQDSVRITLHGKSNIDMYEPVLYLSRGAVSQINFNYCWLEEFSRYYFINKKINTPGNLIELWLELDVLMSYKDVILSQEYLIERTNISDWNSPYLNDAALIPKATKSLQYKQFGSDVITPTSSFVLHTSGFGTNPNP